MLLEWHTALPEKLHATRHAMSLAFQAPPEAHVIVCSNHVLQDMIETQPLSSSSLHLLTASTARWYDVPPPNAT